MSVSVPSPVETPAPTGLRARMLRGAFFELSGYGTQQVIRLGSNLILTRLLFPAAFGLASMVWVITTGIVMLSDVAIHACVIQSKRGDEPSFLNTAFTIQAIRGVGLTILMLGLAKPVAWFYREPNVESLMYLGSLSMLFTGLHSTAVYTLRRRLALGWVNGLELTQTVLSTALTIALAWRYRSPWTLIVGAVSGSFFFAIASHFLPVENRNRFHWDKEAASEIRRFGSWVFGSSATTFLGGQSDRILLGRLLGASWLGVYSIATNLSDAINVIISRLINGVVYPGLSHAGRETGTNISPLFYRMRLRLDVLSMTATGLLAGMGGWIVHTLWDQRYSDAAWILQILAVRLAIALLVAPSETSLFSLGHTRYGFFRSLTRLLATLVALPLGWYIAGIKGVIWGTVAAEIPTILAIWPQSRRLRILRVRRELLSVGIFLVAFAIGHLASPLLPVIHLHRHSH